MFSKKKTILFLVFCTSFLFGCSNDGGYTITWLNYDGSVLEVDRNVHKGTVPTFDDGTPQRAKDEHYSYIFSGWSPTIEVVTRDQIYTAQYNSVQNYIIEWRNYDDTLLMTDYFPRGAIPEYIGKTPTKPSTIDYTYTFSGWNPEVTTVTGNATYTAKFKEELRKYNITWKNSDGSTLETDENDYGSTPSYDGETPIYPDENLVGVFKGWSPEIATVTGNADYTATYDVIEKKSLENTSWDDIKTISKYNKADKYFSVGDKKKVVVNGKDHDVRIIGFNQDKDKDGNTIGITFEFANLISDDQGYSIATQWNDTNDDSTANHDYLNSSIRKALTNEGKGHILWARKGATAWSTEDDYKKSVLEMLPKELTKVLVAPQKTVQCYYRSGSWTDKPIINDDGEYDKLFLLSPKEMGGDSARVGAYAYYQEPDTTKLESLRIKKQVKETELTSYSIIPSDSKQLFSGTVSNYAGYNNKADDTGGGDFWLRSPKTYINYYAGFVFYNGSLNMVGPRVYDTAYAVAPAFCI